VTSLIITHTHRKICLGTSWSGLVFVSG